MINFIIPKTSKGESFFAAQPANLLGAIFFLSLPYVILYWLVPIFSGLTIGNDYGLFPIEQQMEIAYSLRHNSFPIYAPGFAGGQSAAALTLGQAYHPISYLAPLLPGYWDGDALTINTLLRLLSLGVCHLLVFYVLRTFGLNFISSLLLSFITVYNLRMLDHFRYGASLENHTAFIALCAFIMLRFLSPSKWIINVGITASSYFLIVGGHPQIAYLSLLGAALVALITPFFAAALNPGMKVNTQIYLRYWSYILLFTVFGFFLAAPYLLGFYFDFITSNTLRAENTYEWSTTYQDSWGGALRNLYAPLKSDVSGSFGGTSLLMLIVSLPILLVFRQRIPAVVLISLAICVIIFLISLGDATPLHYGTWKYLPFADKFRNPGRYTLVIIFPVLFVLAWLFSPNQNRLIQITHRIQLSLIATVSIVSLFLFLLVNASLDSLFPESSSYTPMKINGFTDLIHNNIFHLGVASLLICAVYGELVTQHKFKYYFLGALFIGVVFLQTALSLRYGTWVVENTPQKTFTEMQVEKQNDFKVNATPGSGMTTSAVDEQLKHTIIEPMLARIYKRIITVKDQTQMWARLAKDRSAHDAVILTTKPIFIRPSNSGTPDEVKLLSATYNKMVFETIASNQALLSTNLPYRANWKVTIDDEDVEVFRANGNETAVFIPPGSHKVEYTYGSTETLIGGVIAAITLLFILLYIAWKSKGSARLFVIAMAFTLPSGILYFWYHSLHHGVPMNTNYEWTTSDFPNKENIAYGKETTASSLYSEQMPFYFYSGKAVDGEIDGEESFATSKSKRPSWSIELGGLHALESVKIHGLAAKSLPIVIYVSTNQENYQIAARITSTSDILRVNLKGLQARYLAIRLERYGVLEFKEVEIYGKPILDN